MGYDKATPLVTEVTGLTCMVCLTTWRKHIPPAGPCDGPAGGD
jgi:hypothetical protein